MTNNIMLDLETMGTTPTSAIIAIGAVCFDKKIKGKFYGVVDLQSSVDVGLTVDASTIMWWMQQSDAARKAFKRKGINLVDALIEFQDWIGKDAIVWGNGAAFDNVLLASAYRLTGLNIPWDFYNDRCYRTMKSLHKNVKPPKFKGTPHRADDDAAHQARHLIKICKKIGVQL